MEKGNLYEKLFLSEQRRSKEMTDRVIRYEIAMRRIHNRCTKFIETAPHEEMEALRRILDIDEIASGLLPYIGEDD